MLFAVRLSQLHHQGPILPHCASQSWRANPLFVTNHLLKQIHNAVTAQLVSVVVTLQVVERFSFAVPVRRPLSLRLPRHAIRLPNCPSQKCNCVIRLPVAILAHTSCSARLLSAGGNSHAATSVLNGVRSRQTMLTEKICVKYQRLSTTPHLAIAQIFRINLWRNGQCQAGDSPLDKLYLVHLLSSLCSLNGLGMAYIKCRDSWNKSPEERKFIRRLDACLITYATLSYFSKYLDLQNVTVSTQMIPRLTS